MSKLTRLKTIFMDNDDGIDKAVYIIQQYGGIVEDRNINIIDIVLNQLVMDAMVFLVLQWGYTY